MSHHLRDFSCLTISAIFSVSPSHRFSVSDQLSVFHHLTISVIFFVWLSQWFSMSHRDGLSGCLLDCLSVRWLVHPSVTFCFGLKCFSVWHGQRVNHIWTVGAFLARDNCVFKRPLSCSLRSFACTAHSAHFAHLLYSTPLCYACFTYLLYSWDVHSLRSLPHGTVEIHEYVIMLLSRFTILSPPDLTLALPSLVSALLGLTSAFHVLINVMVHPCVL